MRQNRMHRTQDQQTRLIETSSVLAIQAPRQPATELEPNIHAGSVTITQFDRTTDAVSIFSAGPSYDANLLVIGDPSAAFPYLRVSNLGVLQLFTTLRILSGTEDAIRLDNDGTAQFFAQEDDPTTPSAGSALLVGGTSEDGSGTIFLWDDAGRNYDIKPATIDWPDAELCAADTLTDDLLDEEASCLM